MKPSHGYIKVIINPASGASSNKLLVRKFLCYLRDGGFDVRCEYTESLAHARSIAHAAAVSYECEMLAVAGGDGTVREAAHGLEGSDKPMMIIPCGTENLLANELGYDEKLSTLVNAFENQIVRLLDLGKTDGRFFTSVAGAGFDGEIVHHVDRYRKGHITHLEYFYPIWQTFWNHKYPVMSVEADGELIFQGKCLVIFGNISRYAVGLPILFKADFSDGLLDVCVYKCNSRLHLVKHAVMTVLKKHTSCKDVIYTQCKNIKISSPEPVQTEIDGDPGPNLPLEVTIVPQAVRVIVPPDAKPAGIRTRIIRILD